MAEASQRVVDDRRRRVLVVDDDPEFAASLCNLLTIRGYDVEAALSPGQAEGILQHFDPQIALLDVRLGRTIGFEFVASLKERRAGIACIMVSAYAEFDSAVEALRHGAENYLRNPVHPDELLTMLATASSGSGWRRRSRSPNRL